MTHPLNAFNPRLFQRLFGQSEEAFPARKLTRPERGKMVAFLLTRQCPPEFPEALLNLGFELEAPTDRAKTVLLTVLDFMGGEGATSGGGKAILSRGLVLLDFLLAHGACHSPMRDPLGGALHRAVALPEDAAVDACTLLLNAGADPQALDNIGFSAMDSCLGLYHARVARVLLNAGFDPDFSNKAGLVPLFHVWLKIEGNQTPEVSRGEKESLLAIFQMLTGARARTDTVVPRIDVSVFSRRRTLPSAVVEWCHQNNLTSLPVGQTLETFFARTKNPVLAALWHIRQEQKILETLPAATGQAPPPGTRRL
jgi:hypothetical protein